MVKVNIRPATVEDCLSVAENIRPEDKAEIWAVALHTPKQALIKGMKFSDFTMAGTVDDEPVCVWGVVTDSLIMGRGTPWMAASKSIERHEKVFLRRTRRGVMELLSGYDKLENYVDARNVRSVKWLSWLGFTIEEPRPYGVLKLPFHKFWMEAGHV